MELSENRDFIGAYTNADRLFYLGDIRRNPALGCTLKYLAEHGLNSFYTGPMVHALCADLAKAGSPLNQQDFFTSHGNPDNTITHHYTGLHALQHPAAHTGRCITRHSQDF